MPTTRIPYLCPFRDLGLGDVLNSDQGLKVDESKTIGTRRDHKILAPFPPYCHTWSLTLTPA